MNFRLKPRLKLHVDGTVSRLAKSPDQAAAELQRAGVSQSEFARINGFTRMTVVDLLRGTRLGLRGEAHKAAVALGLKSGPVVHVNRKGQR